MTREQTFIKHICSHCKNKETELCDIRYRYDNTMYCVNYDSNLIKKRKTPEMWQRW